MTRFVLFIALLLIAAIRAQDGCLFNGKDGNGTTYSANLNVLATDDGYLVNGGDYSYYVNFCKPVPKDCKGKKTYKAFQFSPTDPSLCYYLSSADKDDSKVVLFDINDASKGLILYYQDGEPFQDPTGDTITREAVIILRCDKAATKNPTFQFVGEEHRDKKSNYLIEGTSAVACPTSSGGGSSKPLGDLGIGGLLLIFAVVFFILYFVVGIIVCKFALHKTGFEIVPNVYFWMDFPRLLLDGIMLPIDIIKGFSKKGSYEEVTGQ